MNLIKMFFLGILTAFGALILESIFSIIFSINKNQVNFDFSLTIFTMLFPVIIEEILKMSIIWKVSQKYKEQIFLNSILIAIGFSATEILLNILNSPSNITNSYLFQYCGLLLIHTTTFAIFGLYFLKRKSSRLLNILIPFLPAIFFHFIYNFIIAHNLNLMPYYVFLIILLFCLFVLKLKSSDLFSLPSKKK